MKEISAVISLWNRALAKNLGEDLVGCRWMSRSQNFFTLVLLNTTLLNLKIPEVSRFGLCICNIKIARGSRNRNCLGSRIQDYPLFLWPLVASCSFLPLPAPVLEPGSHSALAWGTWK